VAGAGSRAGCGYGGAKPGPEPGGCHPEPREHPGKAPAAQWDEEKGRGWAGYAGVGRWMGFFFRKSGPLTALIRSTVQNCPIGNLTVGLGCVATTGGSRLFCGDIYYFWREKKKLNE
jgi:hypothetical protein